MSRRSILLLALIAAGSHAARAQSPDDTDSSTASRFPIAVWGSLGLGQGSVHGGNNGMLGVVTRGNVSIGPWLLTYRGSDVGPYFGTGNGVRDDGVLVGLRTGGRRLFGSAALGYVRASSYHQCDQCGREQVNPSVGAFAYDVTLHANYVIAGIQASLSGSTGPSGVKYSALTVGLELGWFGQ
jgi:hypothetical protein